MANIFEQLNLPTNLPLDQKTVVADRTSTSAVPAGVPMGQRYTGLVVWDTNTTGQNTPGLYVWDGSQWNAVSHSGTPVDTGIHVVSEVLVTNGENPLGGDITWSELQSSATGNVSRLTIAYTTIDQAITAGRVVLASSESAGFTFPFRVFSVDPTVTGGTRYMFTQGPNTFFGTTINGTYIGGTGALNTALNAINDWVFTHSVDNEFHSLQPDTGITLAVTDDVATIGVDFTEVAATSRVPANGTPPAAWSDLVEDTDLPAASRQATSLIPSNEFHFTDQDATPNVDYVAFVGSTRDNIQVTALGADVALNGIIELALGAGFADNPLYTEGSARWEADNSAVIYYAFQVGTNLYFGKAQSEVGTSSPYGDDGDIVLRFAGGIDIEDGAILSTYRAGIAFHDRISILDDVTEVVPAGIDTPTRNRILLTGGFLLARDAMMDLNTRQAYTGSLIGETSRTYWFDESAEETIGGLATRGVWYDANTEGNALIGFPATT